MDPEMRAPGWQVRCTRCGFTEPWGKYGIRLAVWSWKKYTIGRCPSCWGIGFHAIEKRRESEGLNATRRVGDRDEGRFPVFGVPPGAHPITSEDVRKLDDEA